MHRVLAALAAFGLLFAPHLAHADDAVGVVETLDYDTGVIVLADGHSFIADDALHIEELHVGEEVRVAYVQSGEDLFAVHFERTR